MIKIPPYLKKGDTIGIVSPAGYMDVEKMQTCIETLDDWGYSVKMGATTHSESANYFSGPDEERRNDLQSMMDDPDVNAILCARGGYGTSRIIDQLNFKRFRKRPKWIIGFSDITVLHAHLYGRYRIASLHAPMAAAFRDKHGNDPYVQSLRSALQGNPASFTIPTHSFNRQGRASGTLVGGNLCMLAHIIGTDSDLDTKNKILFLEDIGEYLYNIDRMLLQLKRSGKLEGLSGAVIGGFSDCKDTERPFGKTVHEIIRDQFAEYDYPVCFGFPVSHDPENYALKIGVKHTLSITNEAVTLIQQ